MSTNAPAGVKIEKKLSIWGILGICFGILIGIIIFCCIFCRRKDNQISDEDEEEDPGIGNLINEGDE